VSEGGGNQEHLTEGESAFPVLLNARQKGSQGQKRAHACRKTKGTSYEGIEDNGQGQAKKVVRIK
jgi:hypothetical protein